MSEAVMDPPGVSLPHAKVSEWTYADLDALPGDTRGYEVVEGGLFASPKPTDQHQLAAHRLCRLLEDAAPRELVVIPDVDLDLGRNVFEPDIMVMHAASFGRRPHRAGDVMLAVEVTSPSSRSMDRIIKPAALAAAGVPHYWRADLDGEPYVEVFVLDAGAYRLAATARAGTALQIDQPFPIMLDPAVLVRQ